MGCPALTYHPSTPLRVTHRGKSLTPENTGAGSQSAYLFGFNGKENDNEVFGATGTFQDYGERAYDTRVGRFFSVDPIAKSYPWYSPYHFAGNTPIWAVDLDGLEPVVTSGRLVGYLVLPGQGPTQIADDLNNPKTQEKYGYTMIRQITWNEIVKDNQKYFASVSNQSNRFDPAFKKLNMNTGDPVFLSSYTRQRSLEEYLVFQTNLRSEYRKELANMTIKMRQIQDKIASNNDAMRQIAQEAKPFGDDPKTGLAIASFIRQLPYSQENTMLSNSLNKLQQSSEFRKGVISEIDKGIATTRHKLKTVRAEF